LGVNPTGNVGSLDIQIEDRRVWAEPTLKISQMPVAFPAPIRGRSRGP
jgi:hypothetical protein